MNADLAHDTTYRHEAHGIAEVLGSGSPLALSVNLAHPVAMAMVIGNEVFVSNYHPLFKGSWLEFCGRPIEDLIDPDAKWGAALLMSDGTVQEAGPDTLLGLRACKAVRSHKIVLEALATEAETQGDPNAETVFALSVDTDGDRTEAVVSTVRERPGLMDLVGAPFNTMVKDARGRSCPLWGEFDAAAAWRVADGTIVVLAPNPKGGRHLQAVHALRGFSA